MPLLDLVLADTPATLAAALASLATMDVIGLDVERADWDRYFRAAALVQVGGFGRVAIIDPLGVDDLSALHEFADARHCVFHAIENDLQPLAALGVAPTEVSDTAIAAAVLGMPTGLETLLRDVLGITLVGDKAAMQRADWEARPLTTGMLEYAAADVADLPALWQALAQRLDESGRRSWYEQMLQAQLDQPSAPDRRDWTRTKGAGRLDAAARQRLRSLWETREELARTTNTAPGRIAPDAVLIDLAGKPPLHEGELGRRGLRRQAVRDYGTTLMAALHRAGSFEPEPARRRRPVTDVDRAKAERLRIIRAERAAQFGIDPGVLCPSRTLLAAVLSDPATGEQLRAALGVLPWQWDVLGEAFCEALNLPPE